VIPKRSERGFILGIHGARNCISEEKGIELAKITNLPVLAMPTELETNIIQPVASADEPPVIALKRLLSRL